MKPTKLLFVALLVLSAVCNVVCQRQKKMPPVSLGEFLENEPHAGSAKVESPPRRQTIGGGGGGGLSREVLAEAASPTPGIGIETKLIKTATARFQVKDTRKVTDAITQLVAKHKAYIAAQLVTSGSDAIQSDLQIRVPSQSFDNLLNDLLAQAIYVESKLIEVKDVTEEFVDLTARLKTQKEVESRYLEILKQAKKVEEILAVEKQLGEIRQEIESRQGRLQFLAHQVTYSTIHLTFSEKLPYQRPPQASFFASLLVSFRGGWSGFLDFLLDLVGAWPFLIMIGLLLALFKRWLKSRRKRKEKAKAGGS